MIELALDPAPTGRDAESLEGLAAQLSALDTDRLSEPADRLLDEAVRIAERLGSTLIVSAEPATDAHDAWASRIGLSPVRELRQLRRPLPVDAQTDLEVRAFQPGVDDMAWLDVNNRAFAWHPEQAEWSAVELRSKQAQAWFDPQGFLLHERDGRIAGFCWTKVHDELDPPAGEIFVVGVDPDFQGLGLGRALVVAGANCLSRQGLTQILLYVESDNAPALAVYERLGFEVDHVRRWYRPRR